MGRRGPGKLLQRTNRERSSLPSAHYRNARVALAPPEPASLELFVRRDPPASPLAALSLALTSPPRRTYGSAQGPRFWKGARDMSTDTGKVVVNRAMSLDGFIAGPGHTMDWI